MSEIIKIDLCPFQGQRLTPHSTQKSFHFIVPAREEEAILQKYTFFFHKNQCQLQEYKGVGVDTFSIHAIHLSQTSQRPRMEVALLKEIEMCKSWSIWEQNTIYQNVMQCDSHKAKNIYLDFF